MVNERPNPEEAVRLALVQWGDLPAAELAARIEQHYGVKIEPKFLPIYKASLRDRERLEQFRARARAATSEPRSGSPSQPE